MKLNLTELFKQNLCSFEMAKKLKEAGITCANTYFAYDNLGEQTSGGWLESLGFEDFYPCINLAFAISMLEDTTVDDMAKIELTVCERPVFTLAPVYTFKYDGELIGKDENLVDLILTVFLRFRKK